MKELVKETIEQNLKNGNNYIIVDPKSNERKNYVIGLIFDDKNRILLAKKMLHGNNVQVLQNCRICKQFFI